MAKLPLEGIRIIDLTQVWAGPYATRLLADLGAEVIKIEAPRRLDAERGALKPLPGTGTYPDNDPGERPYNRHGSFNEYNRSKYGITLDLRTVKGVAIFKRLVKTGDVVIENFALGVMSRFGLGYEDVKQVRPDIIMVSMPAFGNTGPDAAYIGFGPNQEQLSGLTSITGYPGGPPLETGFYWGDPTAGAHAAGAVMAALIYRKRTGKGQFIDFSQREALVSFLGEMVLDYQMNRRNWEPMGNRDISMAPHGCYRCKGEDNWIVITCLNDDEWHRLCQAIGKLELAADPLYTTAIGRWKNQEELNAIVNAWTADHDHIELMHDLQKAGVTAEAVLNHKELMEDPHLNDRGYFEVVTHPEAGTHKYHGVHWKLSKTPGHIRMPAPCFGQHNEQILGGVLGLTKEEIEQLEQETVISRVPLVE